MCRDYSCLAAIVALVAGLQPAPARADDFWQRWGDGKAELDGYALTQPRYGQLHRGTAVLIFVTEDFSDSLRVKADPGKHPPSDVYPVLKLNFVRDFQTGIYDYNLMTSTFLKTEAAFAPVKVSFSSQEWCGHVYQQLLSRGGKLVGEAHSYFDGEADAPLELPLLPDGILEEQIPVLVRGLRGDFLSPGASRTLPFLPSALGPVTAYTVTVEERNGPTTTWTVEAQAPRRLLGWQSSTKEAGRLLGSARLPYWQLHDLGGEKYLKMLGLRVP
jgi:hypothetical protein